MFQIKVYKYDSSQEANGYRGEEFSNAILQGCEVKEDITQEMDTAEITLCGQNFQEEFLPQTKFIIDYYENDILLEDETRHWVVQKDMVEQPILSDDNYFDHHISLIEPSVIAQQRLVDNIAVTYKLKDVNLQEQVTYDLTRQSITHFESGGETTSNIPFGRTERSDFIQGTRYFYRWGKYFEVTDNIQVKQNGVVSSNYYVDTSNGASISFILPKMKIFAGLQNTMNYGFIGNASIDYVIEEALSTNEAEITNVWSGSIIENNALGTRYTPNAIYGENINLAEWILEDISWDYSRYRNFYKKYTDTSKPTPVYETQQITVRNGYIYKITISLHNFTDNLDYNTDGLFIQPNPVGGETVEQPASVLGSRITNKNVLYLNTEWCSAFANYLVFGNDTKQILLCSSTPYSALALLQKAIINSGLYEKEDGVYIADINKSNTPFLIDNAYVDKLSATSIVENFYNQKNLWEIMLDVGHYIHAIPELKFGADDKFLITFNELGRTDQKENLGTKVSIFNSRGVEDYISTTSSYVTNMVQLGGQIREWVAPKTSNENLLVSNDTAEIHTSKPIIELLQVQVKKIANNNDQGIAPNSVADITEYIYEKNVYSLLSLQYNVVPNRGIAMYYELGTNKIVGGDYQLPQANTNLYTDYTFKKIIYSAYNGYPTTTPTPSTPNPWRDLKVNDFIFYVRYRTKDDVRQVHSRPDLRKYLLNSKYDRYPEHNQFNNQTDVLVDSEKFGNNLFGKLIKTGNSTYEITEWHNTFQTVKRKGELYRINGELYYVAKLTNYMYATHIVSQVTYSKDYNELSVVIGIPSEPRFYEISEQSSIHREVAINDLMLITDNVEKIKSSLVEKSLIKNFFHLSQIIFGLNTDYARYALTVFKGDKDIGYYDQTVGQANNYKEILTPINAYSSGQTLTYEWDMVDNYSAGDMSIEAQTPDNTTDDAYRSLMGVNYTDIYGKSALMDFYILGNISSYINDEKIRSLPISPITTHSYRLIGTMSNIEPTQENLTSWVKSQQSDVPPVNYDQVNTSYNGENATYVYLNGYWVKNPTALTNISLWVDKLYATNVDFDKIRNDVNYNGRGLGLLKDNREKISINYNMQLINTSDTFVVSPFFFRPQKTNMKIVFLAEEVNKLSDGYVSTPTIIQDVEYVENSQTKTKTYFDMGISFITDSQQFGLYSGFYIPISYWVEKINSGYFNGTRQKIKAIAVVYNVVEQGQSQIPNETPYIVNKLPFIVARNIPETWTQQDIAKDWYFGCPIKDAVFTKKQ